MLRLEDLSCGYGAFRAVDGLDLEVGEGEVFALVGANGAGKSSTIMAIVGHVDRERQLVGLVVPIGDIRERRRVARCQIHDLGGRVDN